MLFALADRGSAWSHGYDLCRRLGLKAGTLYPILMRLADRGQLDASWESTAPRGRPPRHLYRLSTSGAALVDQLRAERAAAAHAETTGVTRWPRPAPGSASG